MSSLKIEIRYVDQHGDAGYMHVVVNGRSQPSIAIDSATGRDEHFQRQLVQIIQAVYIRGHADAEGECKNKVRQFLDWAKSN